MSDPFVGEIRLFAFSKVPNDWLACNGQSVSISTYQLLYSVIGVTYGGDNVTSFNTPSLAGRVAIGQGQAPSQPTYTIGQPGGQESHTLSEAEMPTHSHALMSSSATADAATPGATLHLATASANNLYAPGGTNMPTFDLMAPCVTTAGNSLPHDNMMPTQVGNYCICAFGIYPSSG
jgi:microcystin-dependent protein